MGPRPKSAECCHNDGDCTNNHVSNLRYDTRSSNQMDRADHGTSNRGRRNGHAKLTAAQALKIRERYVPRVVTYRMLAEEYDVAPESIRNVIKGYTWDWLD